MTTRQLERAVEAAELISAFKTYGLTQTDLAHVAQVDPKTVYAWKAADAQPRAAAYDRLDELRDVVRVLSDSLTARGVGQWLHARNRVLDGARPLEALRDGAQTEVLQAAQAFVDGAYV